MAPSSRIRSIAVAAALVVALAGCGVRANSSYDSAAHGPVGSTKGTTTTTEEQGGIPTFTLPGGSTIPGFDSKQFRQGLIDEFVHVGLTKKQATCMADAMIGSGLTDPSSDPSNIDITRAFDVMANCGVSITDFTGGH